MGAKVIQVIETDLERRGSGKDETCPIRIIRQYWSLDGELLAEVDPVVQPTAANVRGAQMLRDLYGEKPTPIKGGGEKS
jgi:hypothetical protein